MINIQVVAFIFFKLSKNPESLEEYEVDPSEGIDDSLDCNIDCDKLFVLSIIIKKNILIFIINSHYLFKG